MPSKREQEEASRAVEITKPFLAAARQPEQGAWQPIETAPKDSSWILAIMRTGRQAVVRWGGGAWEDDNRLCRDPTLWMPLPAAPTETAAPAAPADEQMREVAYFLEPHFRGATGRDMTAQEAIELIKDGATERDELREALRSLFCCECGNKFTQTEEWGECETHPRIQKLIGENK